MFCFVVVVRIPDIIRIFGNIFPIEKYELPHKNLMINRAPYTIKCKDMKLIM